MLRTRLVAAACRRCCHRSRSRFTARQDSDEARRVRDATTVFGEIMAAEDKAIPQAILGKAEGIAIFPSTVRGGIHRRRHARARHHQRSQERRRWSSPAFLTLTGGSFGLQIGGQAVDLILVVSDRRGLENLVSNQFKLGADVAVAAGPVGRDAQAATDLQLRAQILSYSRARGSVCGRDRQRQHGSPGPRRQRALLRQAVGNEPDCLRTVARHSRARDHLAADARQVLALSCES